MTPKSCIFSLLTWGLLVACSQQGEGDRCIRSNLDADCDTGLVCVAADQLEQSYSSGDGKISDYAADRCCPSDEQNFSDARCKRRTVVSTNNSVGGAGGNGGGPAAAGATTTPAAAGFGNGSGELGGSASSSSAASTGGSSSGGVAGSTNQVDAGSDGLGQAGTAGSAS